MDGVAYIIVMGVSGSGKTTVGKRLAERLGWEFAEGDAFHPDANVAKMSAGTPLTDADRWPWLRAIGKWIDARARAHESAVITCSALRRVYRDLLRENRPGVWFCHLDADSALLESRLARRRGHYMPSSLLPSQLATLEPLQDNEPGTTISAARAVEDIVDAVVTSM
ncbi:MAG TPA: gluconokinase [Stackebrandtia sp.]|jgi:gluconokinase|uniref:gluconokinase n=1 Tax=Stackebrandtia sp. TaxID=2023065 RepID=UPI002D30218A|nr:gluconokinase [Stackebrandtia sp.]HZE40678.1 gluconokinase [Stackebrandtia sp.]